MWRCDACVVWFVISYILCAIPKPRAYDSLGTNKEVFDAEVFAS